MKLNTVYEIVLNGEVVYSCMTKPEANRCFDMLCKLFPGIPISLNGKFKEVK
uniref:Uncharacterized protein n=3 Tax=unclassified Microvirus TaxID=338099 RepID=A0AAU8B5F7_9VIRU